MFTHNEIPAALLATQVKYRQKARRKLPAYFAARCLFLPRAYEQASSELTAAMKPYRGRRCLDLTGGLGVDSFHFSQQFEQVITLEPDPTLAALTAENFRRLGLTNVELRTQTAEAFLASYDGPGFDLIYADPDRRDAQGQRLYDPAAYAPDLLELMPRLRQLSELVVAKVSPLFDVAEARRRFPEVHALRLLGDDKEVKELLIEMGPSVPEAGLYVQLPGQAFAFPLDEPSQPVSLATGPAASYLLEPHAAFYKARRVQALFARFFPQYPGGLSTDDGYWLSPAAPPADFPGRAYRIQAQGPYKVKALRRQFKAAGIGALHYHRRHFPWTTKALRQQLGLPEGGQYHLLATTVAGRPWAYVAESLANAGGWSVGSRGLKPPG